MCTPDCRCYEGENGENKQKWVNYGNDVLSIYGRNAGDKMLEVNGNMTYPLKWTNDTTKAMHTFE